MKNNRSLVVSVATKKDLEKITKTTKYINIDITNCTHEVIEHFLTKGENYLYSETIDENKTQIDIDEAFSEYGIDSILLIEAIAKLNRKLNIVLKTTDLFTEEFHVQ